MSMQLEGLSSSITHEYDPLPDDDSIRLMHLEPALDFNAPLHFAFSHGRLPDLVAQYEAISYTWGEPKLTFPLHIGGTHVMVTRNLDQALRELRHATRERALWADAVCINQTDDKEKSRQIPLMTKIYRGAMCVLAWLNGGVDEERGLRMINALSRPDMAGRQKTHGRMTSHATSENPGSGLFEYEHEDLYKVQSKTSLESEETRPVSLRETDDTALCIHQFFNLPWFTRVWIIQEIVMNVDIVLICGGSEITWVRLMVALTAIKSFLDTDTDTRWQGKLNGLTLIDTLWRQHNRIGEAPPEESDVSSKKHTRHVFWDELDKNPGPRRGGILGLVSIFSTYHCSDDRDRIYAFYAMASDIQPAHHHLDAGELSFHNRNKPENWRGWYRSLDLADAVDGAQLTVSMDVSYALTTCQLYQAFAASCIRSSRAPFVLDDVLSRPYHPHSHDWPSWVPDWRKPRSAKDHHPLGTSIICNLVTPDILALTQRGKNAFESGNFLIVESTTPVPQDIASFASLLHTVCRDWPLLCVKDMVPDSIFQSSHDILEDRHEFARSILLSSEVSTHNRPIYQKLHTIMQDQCFYTATSTLNANIISGYGSSAMSKGDKIVPLSGNAWSSPAYWATLQGLVLRYKSTHSGIEEGRIDTHSLIGVAWVADTSMDPDHSGGWAVDEPNSDDENDERAYWDPSICSKLYLE